MSFLQQYLDINIANSAVPNNGNNNVINNDNSNNSKSNSNKNLNTNSNNIIISMAQQNDQQQTENQNYLNNDINQILQDQDILSSDSLANFQKICQKYSLKEEDIISLINTIQNVGTDSNQNTQDNIQPGIQGVNPSPEQITTATQQMMENVNANINFNIAHNQDQNNQLVEQQGREFMSNKQEIDCENSEKKEKNLNSGITFEQDCFVAHSIKNDIKQKQLDNTSSQSQSQAQSQKSLQQEKPQTEVGQQPPQQQQQQQMQTQKSFQNLQIKTKTQSTEQDDELSRKNNLICENGEISFNKDIANYFDSLPNGEEEENTKQLQNLNQNNINFNSIQQQQSTEGNENQVQTNGSIKQKEVPTSDNYFTFLQNNMNQEFILISQENIKLKQEILELKGKLAGLVENKKNYETTIESLKQNQTYLQEILKKKEDDYNTLFDKYNELVSEMQSIMKQQSQKQLILSQQQTPGIQTPVQPLKENICTINRQVTEQDQNSKPSSQTNRCSSNLQCFKPDPQLIAQNIINYDYSQNQKPVLQISNISNLQKSQTKKSNNTSVPCKPICNQDEQNLWKKNYSPLRRNISNNVYAQSYAQQRLSKQSSKSPSTRKPELIQGTERPKVVEKKNYSEQYKKQRTNIYENYSHHADKNLIDEMRNYCFRKK